MNFDPSDTETLSDTSSTPALKRWADSAAAAHAETTTAISSRRNMGYFFCGRRVRARAVSPGLLTVTCSFSGGTSASGRP